MRQFLMVVAVVGMMFLGPTVSGDKTQFCMGALHAQTLQAQASSQDPVMPPEGNPDHKEPPNGAFCDHSDRPAHACKCHAECKAGPDGKVYLQEDGIHCRAWCYKKHCHCPADCE